MHEMTESGEYVKCLHVAAAGLAFLSLCRHRPLSSVELEAKVFSAAFCNKRVERLSRREDMQQNLPEYTNMLYRIIFNLVFLAACLWAFVSRFCR